MLPRSVIRHVPISLLACLLLVAFQEQGDVGVEDYDTRSKHPNIVILYTDDLGYGDVGVYGATAVKTPNIDALAASGIRFTDAHSTAATCTPSRFSLLTGRHGFRNDSEILPGDAPLLIRPGISTIASMLGNAGYRTAVVGKWHLGLGDGDVDWNVEIEPGPLDIGFHYSFLLPATGDRVPTVFVEQRRVVGLDPGDPVSVSYKERIGDRPTGVDHPELLRVHADRQHSDSIVNGVSRIGYMSGGRSAEWVDEEFADVFTAKATQFMEEKNGQPFFLFYSFHDIHVPRLPNQRFVGATEMGPRGDSIAQVDWVVGAIIDKLDELGIADDTLLIFTSDNGPVLDDGYSDQASDLLGDHNPSGPYRGGKYSAYEAGTRVPTIVSWPGHTTPSVSHALLSQLDLYASLASLVGESIHHGQAIDSRDQLDAWLGKNMHGRSELLLESVGTISLRSGNYKYVRPIGPDTQLPNWLAAKDIEMGFTTMPQLYDLSGDPAERTNLHQTMPDRAAEMALRLDSIVETTY